MTAHLTERRFTVPVMCTDGETGDQLRSAINNITYAIDGAYTQYNDFRKVLESYDEVYGAQITEIEAIYSIIDEECPNTKDFIKDALHFVAASIPRESEIRSRMDAAKRRMDELSDELSETRTKLARLRESIDVSADYLEDAFRRCPHYVDGSLMMKNDKITYRLTNVIMTPEHLDGDVVQRIHAGPIKLADIEIQFNSRRGIVELYPVNIDRSTPITGYSSAAPHPHTVNHTQACLGEFNSPYTVAIMDGDFVSAFYIVLAFLQSANGQDSAGRYWPLFAASRYEPYRSYLLDSSISNDWAAWESWAYHNLDSENDYIVPDPNNPGEYMLSRQVGLTSTLEVDSPEPEQNVSEQVSDEETPFETERDPEWTFNHVQVQQLYDVMTGATEALHFDEAVRDIAHTEDTTGVDPSQMVQTFTEGPVPPVTNERVSDTLHALSYANIGGGLAQHIVAADAVPTFRIGTNEPIVFRNTDVVLNVPTHHPEAPYVDGPEEDN